MPKVTGCNTDNVKDMKWNCLGGKELLSVGNFVMLSGVMYDVEFLLVSNVKVMMPKMSSE